MHSEGYSSWFVCLSVCLCVCVCVGVDAYSGPTGYEAANDRYQRLQNYTSLKNKRAIFLKRLRSRGEKANIMHTHTGLTAT